MVPQVLLITEGMTAAGQLLPRDDEYAKDVHLVTLCSRQEKGWRGKAEHGGEWISARG